MWPHLVVMHDVSCPRPPPPPPPPSPPAVSVACGLVHHCMCVACLVVSSCACGHTLWLSSTGVLTGCRTHQHREPPRGRQAQKRDHRQGQPSLLPWPQRKPTGTLFTGNACGWLYNLSFVYVDISPVDWECGHLWKSPSIPVECPSWVMHHTLYVSMP